LSKRNIYWLIFIIVLFGLALWAILPVNAKLLGPNGLSLGLDLRGGSQLLYEANLSLKDPSVSDAEAMAAVAGKIQKRISAKYPAMEPTVQTQGTDRILVQLPGLENITEAVNLIGKTALLDFREQKFNVNGTPMLDELGNPIYQDEPAKAAGRDGQEKELTGKYLNRAYREVDPTAGPVVFLQWNDEGAYLFEQITKRNVGKRLAIFLDNEMISAPVVEATITATERGYIKGQFTIDEAGSLAIQLNSGSLDVPLTIIGQENINPTLGADSIQKSKQAAIIGIVLLLLFMALYYRLPGVIACISLGFYGVFFSAILSVFPITLTLPSIAGVILSVGMAVDAHVLIFERMKEELRSGRTLGAALEAGSSRAWPAIRDSNITTFIACAILFWLGMSSAFHASMITGFAITLFIGVALSMFTAVIITRIFLRFIVGSRLVTNLAAYGVRV
jgi:preprotein translocase subunit SecD